MSGHARHRAKSSWTPLGNDETNKKIFEERRALLGLWFDRWSDEQRKRVLEDLFSKCKLKQMAFAGKLVNKRVPVYKEDFTKTLPRIIALYIFSFLDPRSLCRCSQVCWYWKFLAELDHIWMPKCMRLGWIITFTPSPYETGIWKRHYIENIKSLRYLRPKVAVACQTQDSQESVSQVCQFCTRCSQSLQRETRVRETTMSQTADAGTTTPSASLILSFFDFEELPAKTEISSPVPPELPSRELSDLHLDDRGGGDTERSIRSATSSMSYNRRPPPSRPKSSSKKPPPWKGSDPVPKDIWRNNYLENDDEVEKVKKIRQKATYSSELTDIESRARSKIKTGSVKKRSSSASRAQSKTPLSPTESIPFGERPDWAKHTSGTPFVNQSNMGDPIQSTNAGVRPQPLHTYSKAKQRTARDPPSSELFPDRPWRVPDYDDDNDSDIF